MKAAWIQLILKSLGKVLTIFKVSDWLKNKWENRKKKTMGLKQISGSTQIIFTIKSFAALIGAMLGLFYGFYQLVVVPKVNATESHYEKMFEAQKEQNIITSQELIKINTSIGTLNGTVEALIREKSNQPVANTGGSFGGNTNVPLVNGINRTSINGVVTDSSGGH